MIISEEKKQAIKEEFESWKDKMYAGKTLQERQDMGQFFTPPELTIKMLEKFSDCKDSILDPCLGAGGLIAGAILAGFNPKECYGIELDPDILKIAKDRLCSMGVPEWHLHLGDALISECYEFSENYPYNDPKKLKDLQDLKAQQKEEKSIPLPKTGFGNFMKH